MARAGFGNPKGKIKATVYLCPKCNGDLTSIKIENRVMGLTCMNKCIKLSKPESLLSGGGDWTKDHTNFSAGCDVTFRKNEFSSLKVKEKKPKEDSDQRADE
jgi:hypothetical protein